MVIGVGGRLCSGKSVVCGELVRRGYSLIDVDTVGHEALETCREELAGEFGEHILSGDGSVDRSVLGRIVFSSRRALRALERIVHPGMRERVRDIVSAKRAESEEGSGGADIVIDAALLFVLGLDAYCDTIIWLTSPLGRTLARARKRSNVSVPRALRILWMQRKLVLNTDCGNADIIQVKNNKSIDALIAVVGDCLDGGGVTG